MPMSREVADFYFQTNNTSTPAYMSSALSSGFIMSGSGARAPVAPACPGAFPLSPAFLYLPCLLN